MTKYASHSRFHPLRLNSLANKPPRWQIGGKMSELLRLQKFIADCGITSRRKGEDLILQGRVQVNGETVRELGVKVNPSQDVVYVDGKIADLNAVKKVYVVMNKPRGVMTTVSDPEGRKTIMDFCQEVSERIYPVGRLDYLSEGLLLLTNDGEVANMIMHPAFNVTKVYEVKVFGAVNDSLLKKLRAGVYHDGDFLKPKAVRVIKQLRGKTWLEFRLSDGKNREIRRLCEACGLTVDKLKRMAIEGITVEGIAPGSIRYTSKKHLLDALGLDFNGRKVKDMEYLSPKKSVNLKKRVQNCSSADDEGFVKYRKETYFKSIEAIKKSKALKIEKEEQAAREERERLFQEKKKRRVARAKKREESRFKPVHAQFVK